MNYKTPVVQLISDAEHDAMKTTRELRDIIHDLIPMMRELSECLKRSNK